MRAVLPVHAAREVESLWLEYEAASSPEALLVKDFDKLEMVVTAFQYEQVRTAGVRTRVRAHVVVDVHEDARHLAVDESCAGRVQPCVCCLCVTFGGNISFSRQEQVRVRTSGQRQLINRFVCVPV